MTVNELVKRLNNLQGNITVGQLNEIIQDFDIEQEPCEDCIDRSKLGLTDFEIIMCDGDYKEALKMLLDKIEKAPSVYPTASFINKPCISEGVCHDIAVQKMIKCEDAVSRQAVLDLTKKGVLISNGNYDSVCKAINELPSVTPHPKTGHWIDIMVGDMPAQACDRCNTFYPLAYTGGGHKYCPNCGAKMESEDKDGKNNSRTL